MLTFLFFHMIFHYFILYFNLFNINDIIKYGINIYNTIYFSIKINENNNENNNLIINKFIKNISLELTPILIILQQLDEISQLQKFKELEKNYPFISYIYPINKNDDIKDLIKKYIFYVNEIYK
jgi:hypothetical protein